MSKLLGVSGSWYGRLGQEKGERVQLRREWENSEVWVDWGEAGSWELGAGTSWLLRALAPFHHEAEPKLPDGQTCPSLPHLDIT